MLSLETQLCFVHIPKCAGTSIERALLPFTEGRDDPARVLIRRNRNPLRGPPWLQHLTAEEYVNKGYVTQQQWNRLRTFTIVRNPFARIVSEYNAKGKTRKMKLLGVDWNFKNFVTHCLPSWYEDNYFRGFDNYRHVLPQYRFIYSRDGECLVQRVVKQEDLNKHWQPLCEWLHIDPISLPSVNEAPARDPNDGHRLLTEKLPWQDYYDQQSESAVIDRYHNDFKLLQYKISR